MNLNLKAIALVSILTCLLLSGCGGISLNHDYYDYSDVYGKSVNKQLLLNLARLSRDEPPYFLQLSTISALHTLTGSVGLNPTSTGVGKGTGLTQLAGTSMLTGTETPTFGFAPLAGADFAKAINSPISQKVFYTFYDQNVPADILARTMIASLDVTSPSGSHTLINDPRDTTYPDFLVWCYYLRICQERKILQVNLVDSSNPLIVKDNGFTDLTKGIDYNFEITQATGDNYKAGYKEPALKFIEAPPAGISPYHFSFTTGPTQTFNSFMSTFSSTDQKPSPTPRKTPPVFTAKMRTFLTVMEGVAKEQNAFATRFTKAVTGNDGEPIYYAGTTPMPCRPLITIRRDDHYPPDANLEILAQINYASHDYTIGDVVDANENLEVARDTPSRPAVKADALLTSNREAFGLLSYLFTQITINPKDLPVQQLIQVQ